MAARPPGLSGYLADWSPAPVTEEDVLAARPVAAFAALLDREDAPGAGEPLPPLWHWFHFPDWPPQRALAADGHLAEGRFIPPIPGRRRMFAGGRLTVRRPLEIGAAATCTSALAAARVRRGRTGELAFVTVRSEYRQGGAPRLVEEQDLVYRAGEAPHRAFERPSGPPEPTAAPWQARPALSETLLFRFSALTANPHRIHYDEPYVRRVEGYPGLVVHGPLLALLMLELVREHRPDATVTEFTYRLRHPVFLGDEFLVSGGPEGTDAVRLAVTTAGERVVAEGRVSLR
ncbi:3-methylfumaryl-CoA hydratase [Prauserella shujinwangii]|uniref:3-methylfumaryl-CoA hydratase n=1 Tax=Prauserella shujinwangii TaxID=1453103 RepID=A0A2T0LL61_9PSEU|nr:MaoC family dehydratase N-terminal domain-containing protein [Prauserella shujinwangii]PRX43642.1 3-methylfumaryl-CoA hydratase [Prauserella shujinwangii]